MIKASEVRFRQEKLQETFFQQIETTIITAADAGRVLVDVPIPKPLAPYGEAIADKMRSYGYDVQHIRGHDFREEWNFLRIEW